MAQVSVFTRLLRHWAAIQTPAAPSYKCWNTASNCLAVLFTCDFTAICSTSWYVLVKCQYGTYRCDQRFVELLTFDPGDWAAIFWSAVLPKTLDIIITNMDDNMSWLHFTLWTQNVKELWLRPCEWWEGWCRSLWDEDSDVENLMYTLLAMLLLYRNINNRYKVVLSCVFMLCSIWASHKSQNMRANAEQQRGFSHQPLPQRLYLNEHLVL